ncbi:hypothetical protein EIP91_002503 [Steccherinum ochraceum]|uniref:Uncharacterized protein n=1 Tax=Steccherinum ochraceum TaxID=92696 RepID=A0A4R0RKH6_9APHY|nr:hypothetical protein EIP91_002503 [Steccherinum ochraceum]
MPKTKTKAAIKYKFLPPYSSAHSRRLGRSSCNRVAFRPTAEGTTSDEQQHVVPAKLTPEDSHSVRCLFSRAIKDWPEEKIRRFEVYMRSLYRVPSPPKPNWPYFFGFYVTEAEICRFSEDYNENSDGPIDDLTADHLHFLCNSLSVLMETRSSVRVHRGLVTVEEKTHFPEIEEDVGDWCYIVSMLSLNEFNSGYRPNNREVKEFVTFLKRKPSWWEATL